MRFFIPAPQVIKAARELEECEMGGYVFEAEPIDPASPKVYQRTPHGDKIRVTAVVCTECGHENPMKDMEVELE